MGKYLLIVLVIVIFLAGCTNEAIHDIRLEQPEEYLAFELQQIPPPAWIFNGLSPDQVRQLMLSCGLTPQQVERALAPALVSVSPSSTTVKPDDDLVFSLSPQVRANRRGDNSLSRKNVHPAPVRPL